MASKSETKYFTSCTETVLKKQAAIFMNSGIKNYITILLLKTYLSVKHCLPT